MISKTSNCCFVAVGQAKLNQQVGSHSQRSVVIPIFSTATNMSENTIQTHTLIKTMKNIQKTRVLTYQVRLSCFSSSTVKGQSCNCLVEKAASSCFCYKIWIWSRRLGNLASGFLLVPRTHTQSLF